MSQRQAKRARQLVRSLRDIITEHGPVLTSGARWNDDVWLEILYTPRQRRRAEAVVARKAPKPPPERKFSRDEQPILTVTQEVSP